jgi:hypothetical protein
LFVAPIHFHPELLATKDELALRGTFKGFGRQQESRGGIEDIVENIYQVLYPSIVYRLSSSTNKSVIVTFNRVSTKQFYDCRRCLGARINIFPLGSVHLKITVFLSVHFGYFGG